VTLEREASYTGERPDVAALVPRARRILDVGCATGAVGEALKRRTGAEVWGVEPDEALARDAERRLDRLLAVPVEEAIGALRDERFDVVVCADVLEHLDDPEATLRALRSLLEPGSCMVVSLPNVRFYDTFVQLALRGTWPRRERGLFDRTHRHWFTDGDARALFDSAGLVVEKAAANYRLVERPARLNRHARLFARGPLRPFLAYQYLYRLRPAASG
jgi:2-polyprenyl-3-methyl-5-hydroxy-6-metoxy-1,4-benzoquinol methylase